MTYQLLFVCTGNICRSPTAEGVLQHLLQVEGGLPVRVESAATNSYHVGDPPDPRSVAAAKKRGYDLSAIRARQLHPGDFSAFDLMLGLDETHLHHLQRIQPKQSKATTALFLEYAGLGEYATVPDPYYGEAEGFERTLDLVEAGAKGLIERFRREFAT